MTGHPRHELAHRDPMPLGKLPQLGCGLGRETELYLDRAALRFGDGHGSATVVERAALRAQRADDVRVPLVDAARHGRFRSAGVLEVTVELLIGLLAGETAFAAAAGPAVTAAGVALVADPFHTPILIGGYPPSSENRPARVAEPSSSDQGEPK